jgi:hypothetical protein
MLDTTNTNNYAYITKHLEIHILGGNIDILKTPVVDYTTS